MKFSSEWRCSTVQLKFLRYMMTIRFSRIETWYCISYSRSQEDPICNLLSQSWQRTWTIHHADTVLFSLQKWRYELRWKTQSTEERHNFLLWHFHHNKIRFVRRVSQRLLFRSYRNAQLFLHSIVSIVKLEFQSQFPFRLAPESINCFVLWTFLTLAQDCRVIFSGL